MIIGVPKEIKKQWLLVFNAIYNKNYTDFPIRINVHKSIMLNMLLDKYIWFSLMVIHNNKIHSKMHYCNGQYIHIKNNTLYIIMPNLAIYKF